MLTSPYEWQILEWDEKRQTNKRWVSCVGYCQISFTSWISGFYEINLFTNISDCKFFKITVTEYPWAMIPQIRERLDKKSFFSILLILFRNYSKIHNKEKNRFWMFVKLLLGWTSLRKRFKSNKMCLWNTNASDDGQFQRSKVHKDKYLNSSTKKSHLQYGSSNIYYFSWFLFIISKIVSKVKVKRFSINIKDLITRNIHVNDENSGTHWWKVISKVKYFKK